ncbi:MAG: SusD/RagB family nutrient-binding outer membrane lipoprotein [Bacteroidales bacterium]|nr:SusD/RagB family nutrient-binding outer membrane lipoprotein [Bacteroidales bacterium]MBQ1754988.1 SusD/RagB family nutrient-binding outer membrane lipoprotein [Bacteroidales bacterium]MBQ1831600.1 SusD/RagB family nutrient-binding outer membrane lipoprotein [Bacteroidales bacterium]MBQ2195026.1 SusD/RagB family nutrient-binding outer membrane lipoprotein [Bacteroidales bacterium]MBQ5518249.1 SusD/RagB family nutrient-binding outer membrane lipoprotein [Bacteroidales bacterium]
MKAKHIFIALLTVCVLGLSSCMEQFAELNQNPSDVSTPNPAYMATRAQMLFETNDYLMWFYNQALYTKWSQLGATGSYTEGTFGMGTAVHWQNTYITMLNYRNDIYNYIQAYEHPEMEAYAAMCGVLAVYGAIFSSDINGDIQYSEACQYKYGGSLTPKYDHVEDLYNTLIEELDDYISVFQDGSQVVTPRQDLIYNGDLAKWARMANTLKLKIAVRLYNNNADKAKQIASSVASSSAGYINSLEDAFIFHKADATTGGDTAYQTGNGLAGYMSTGSKNVIDFMKACKDPRVRFFYEKNDYNSKVVQCFIEAGKYEDLPGFVKENIERDADGNFVAWKGDVEPWVRYQGIPIVFRDSPEYNALKGEYFDYADRYSVKVGNATKSFGMFSAYNEEMVRGRVDFTLPTIPGGPSIRDTEDVPWWGMYLGAGETNLYLAEMAMLGASVGGSAESFYNRGVQLSVQEWDYIAGKNKIPYYNATYNYAPDEVSIELKDGEIAAMMATPAVKWDGSIEKVYLQQLMNFSMLPNEQFVTARRSGYPKIGSNLLPFVKFKEVELTAIPRRFEFTTPLITDVMHDIRLQSLKDQGFTPGSAQSGMGFASTTVLNTERLWQDKNAPQWGSAK